MFTCTNKMLDHIYACTVISEHGQDVIIEQLFTPIKFKCVISSNPSR